MAETADKKFWKSRTFWKDAIVLITTIAAHFVPFVNAFITSYPEFYLPILSVLGLILRFDTDQAIETPFLKK